MIYLITFLLSLGQLQRVSLFSGSVNFYLHEVVMTFLLLLFFSKQKVTKNHLFVPATVFISTLLLSLLNNSWNFTGTQNIVGVLYILRLCLYFLFFFCLKTISKQVLEKGLELYALMTIFLSVIQYVLFPKLHNFVGLGFDPHEYRMVGTFFDVSVAGIIYIFLLFFVSYQSFKEGLSNRKLRFIQACIFLGLILLTFSRITYIGFFVSILYLIFYKPPIKNIILIVFLFLFLISILPRHSSGESNRLERTFSIYTRFEDIKDGILLWQKNPILGVGYNRIQYFKFRTNSNIPDHASTGFSSTYVTILAGAGVVGLIGFLILVFSVYRNLKLWGRILLVPLLIVSSLDNVFFHALVLPIFLLLISFVDY